MAGISVEAQKSPSLLRAVSAALEKTTAIKPVLIQTAEHRFSNRFVRLYPYQIESLATAFNLEEYEESIRTLSDYFYQFIGDPDQAKKDRANLIIEDYRGKTKRIAQEYESKSGISVFQLRPTQMELQTTVIPVPDDMRVFLEHPVSTLMAIKDQFILEGSLFQGAVYPHVNDYGDINSLNQLTSVGSYIHHSLEEIPKFFRS